RGEINGTTAAYDGEILVPPGPGGKFSPAKDFLELIQRSQRRVGRMIIVALLRRVQTMKSSGWRHPIEQGIYHGVEIVQFDAFDREILAQYLKLPRIISLGEEIQV